MAARISKLCRRNPLSPSIRYTLSYRTSSNAPPSSKGERLIGLMDSYSDAPAGMWHQLYHARIFFKDFFDNGCSSEDGIEFAKNWVKMRGYICGVKTQCLYIYTYNHQ